MEEVLNAKVRYSKYQLIWDECVVKLGQDKMKICQKNRSKYEIEFRDIINVYTSKVHYLTLRLKSGKYNLWIKLEQYPMLMRWQGYIYQHTTSGQCALSIMRSRSNISMKSKTYSESSKSINKI